MITLPAAVDAAMPYAGTCPTCDLDDARHLVLDAVRTRRDSGHSLRSIAQDLGLTRLMVWRIAEHWDDAAKVWAS